MNYHILFLLSGFVPVVSLLIGLPLIRIGAKADKILLGYIFITFLSNLASIMSAYKNTNNLWMMNVYTPFQFSMLIWLMSRWHQTAVEKVFLLSIPAFIAFWLIALLFFENVRDFNSYTRPLEALILICAAGYTLFQINKDEIDSILRKPNFWVTSSILVYFTGMIVLFTLSNVLLKEEVQTLKLVWAPIQTFSNVSANLLFVVGFLCQRPQ